MEESKVRPSPGTSDTYSSSHCCMETFIKDKLKKCDCQAVWHVSDEDAAMF